MSGKKLHGQTTFLSVLILTLIVMTPCDTPAAGITWEILNGFGYASLALLLAMVWEARTPARTRRLRLHQGYATAATGLSMVHAAGFLVCVPLLIEHLKPTAPLHMWMAVLALLLLLFVTIFSFVPWRGHLYGRFSIFHFWHVSLTLLLLLASIVHVIGASATFASVPRSMLLVALMFGIPLVAIRLRTQGIQPGLEPEPETNRSADWQSAMTCSALAVFAILFGALRQL